MTDVPGSGSEEILSPKTVYEFIKNSDPDCSVDYSITNNAYVEVTEEEKGFLSIN